MSLCHNFACISTSDKSSSHSMANYVVRCLFDRAVTTASCTQTSGGVGFFCCSDDIGSEALSAACRSLSWPRGLRLVNTSHRCCVSWRERKKYSRFFTLKYINTVARPESNGVQMAAIEAVLAKNRAARVRLNAQRLDLSLSLSLSSHLISCQSPK